MHDFPALLRLALLVLAVLFAGGAATAQDDLYGAERDRWLLNLRGSYQYINTDANGANDEVEAFDLGGGLSWFLRREHEFGANLTTRVFKGEAGADSRSFALEPFYNYNMWSSPRANWYVGAHLGWVHVDQSGASAANAPAYGLQGGIRYWASPSVSLFLEPNLTLTELDSDQGGTERSVRFLFGVSVRL